MHPLTREGRKESNYSKPNICLVKELMWEYYKKEQNECKGEQRKK